MGLDMSLTAEGRFSSYDHYQNKENYCALMKAIGLGEFISPIPSTTVKVNVAYWRKANQVHAWFVREVQKGNDDCKEYEVDREQLVALVILCKQALAEKDRASQILPSQEGFFFGSTEYDDSYFEDLESTIKQIEPLLTDPRFKDWEFHYHSSW